MNKEPIDLRITPHETNVIKGIAICAMLFHHLFFETSSYGILTQQIAILCKVCVSMFLFVSGYGLAVQYTKIGSNNKIQSKFTETLLFLARRLLKFYLNYWVIFIILVPMDVFILGAPLSATYGTENDIWESLIKDILGIQGFDSYIITWWFNALIISLYLLFPFLYWFMSKKAIAIGMLALLFLWPRDYIVENFFYVFELWNSNLIVYSLIFSLGIFFARHAIFFNKILNKVGIQLTFTLSIAITTGLCFARQLYTKNLIDSITTDAFITIFFTLSTICFIRLTKFQIKTLSFLGMHSMNIYLIHTFILTYIFPETIFKSKFPLIIFAFLLAESLTISIIIEFLKKFFHFYKLQDFIYKKIPLQTI